MHVAHTYRLATRGLFAAAFQFVFSHIFSEQPTEPFALGLLFFKWMTFERVLDKIGCNIFSGEINAEYCPRNCCNNYTNCKRVSN